MSGARMKMIFLSIESAPIDVELICDKMTRIRLLNVNRTVIPSRTGYPFFFFTVTPSVRFFSDYLKLNW